MSELEIDRMVAENRRRWSVWQQPYHPEEGRGSLIGPRVEIALKDAPLPRQWIPEEMLKVPFVSSLKETGSLKGFIEEELQQSFSADLLDEIWKRWVRIRIAYDFEFWAALFVRIKDKQSDQDIPFVLNRPQRRVLQTLESMRRTKEPIRLILLKARQWGGSTLVQIYMAWIQLVHRCNWNSVICGHLKDAAANIRGMYSKLLSYYPAWLLEEEEPVRLQPFEKMTNTLMIRQRGCKITVGSSETPESIRGADAVMAHLSEVAFWSNTRTKSPEALIRSVCGTVALLPDSMIVLESTANGTGNFFHKECMRAKRGESDKRFLFVPWFEVEMYTLAIDDPHAFVSSFSSYEEGLWRKGATLEGIAWYRKKSKEYQDATDMMAEYPSDEVEAFVYSGERVFDCRQVERLRRHCKDPEQKGELQGEAESGARALRSLRFVLEQQGLFWVWTMPEKEPPVQNRYVVVVDIGGRSQKADYSVIVVFDRYWMLHGGVPEVVAQWRGHIDHDLLAWKAAQIATFYNKALLVIESNTLETEHEEGGATVYILDALAQSYTNLYARPAPAEMIRATAPTRWGFHMNRATKQVVVNHQIRMLREEGYVERDAQTCYEHDVFERKANGAYGAMDGHHDDLLVTRCIGNYICYSQPLLPPVIWRKELSSTPISEASIG